MIRTIAVMFVVGAGIMAGACGDPETLNQQAAPTNTADSSYTPTGETTRLRVEAVESQIACDGATHDVRIWLDDLARDGGVYAAQARLTWDPAVLWLTGKEDVRIAEGLVDRAGEGPPFMLSVGPLDNTNGEVLFGVISIDTEATPLPEDPGVTDLTGRRLDPVAAGGPILLATIGMTAKGAGEVDVSLRDPLLFVEPGDSYGADEVVPSTVEVTGECDPFATATPYPTATGQAIVAPPTEAPASTPAALTPVPAELVRDDCPATWLVYVEPQTFSVCYPPDLAGTARDGAVGIASDAGSDTPQVYVSLAIAGYPPFALPVGDTCASTAGLPGQIGQGEPATLTIDGLVAEGCHFTGESSASNGTLESLIVTLELPSRPGSYLHLTLNWRTDSVGAKELIDRIVTLIDLAQ
jgi:hypothetical protein